jgi:hypothetical protein
MNVFALTNRPLRTALLASLFAAHAVAEPVPDPTRPMATMLGDAADPRSAKTTRSGPPAAATSASAVVAAPRLQSVRLASNPSASTALLDGRLVRLGDRIGEHSIAAIDRNGITLRGPRGEQRLSLLLGITQTASREAPPATDMLATGTPQDKKP